VSFPAIAVAYVALYIGAGWTLADSPFARSVFGTIGLLIPPGLVVALVLRRRRDWAGCQRLFWDTVAIGMGLWFIGHIGWAFDDIVRQQPSWLQWHTLFSLCGGAAPLVALVARPHRGVRGEALSRTALDITSYGLLVAFICAYFVLIPSVLPERAAVAQVTLLVVTIVLRFAILTAMSLMVWITGGTEWAPTFRRIAIGVAIGFLLRIETSVAILTGSYHAGTIRDLAWIVPFLFYGWAVLAAPRSPLVRDRIAVPVSASPAVLSAVPVLLIPLVGYGWLQSHSLGDAGDSFRGLLTSLATVAGLGLLTLRLAAQGDELQRSDARLKLLAAATEQTGDLILILRANGDFEHANEAFLRAMRYSRDELASLHFADLIDRGFEKLADEIAADVRARGVWRGTLLRRRRDGSRFPASCTVVSLKDGAGKTTHFVGVERDITEELQLRDQLVHSERLSAIGELVAGVAHEINNPLQTIVGCVELLLDEHPEAGMRRDLELVRKEAARAGQIVRNLLAFVRRSTPDRTPADLNQMVRVTLELREYHLQQCGIQLVVRAHDGPLPVLANREEIQQVVLNLLLNAEQAIAAAADRGTITVRTTQSDGTASVEIADDGPGISPDLRGRIFEPFFTTKDVGEGTGLGLSISHGIASAHGGTLELVPTAIGACFRLTLPVHLEARAGAPTALPTTQSSPGGRIALVVDDQEPIRKLLARLLQRRGFKVLEAETGEAAVALGAVRDLALVVCDVRMPGLSGTEVLARLSTLDSSISRRFIFVTGDATQVGQAASAPAGIAVLPKPFTATDLDAVLSRIGIAVTV
jgi:PAS domain S-box-containing protein